MRTWGGRRVVAALAVVAVAMAGACSSGEGEGGNDGAGGGGNNGGATTTEAAALPAGYEGYQSEVYADDAHWLCRPGKADDVCARDLDATVVEADGSTEVQPHEVAAGPAVDCFYVYPTTSQDEGLNSDLEPQENQEVATVVNQAARLTATCRVFAPVYRQVTLGGIGGDADAEPGVDPRQVAYDDVVDAFRHFVANDSDGRGFVLVGHSQGSGVLTRLIAAEVDGEPALRDRLVGAYLLGSSVAVPEGEVVGGDFENIPLCEATDQVGCAVTYASFRSTAPPPANSFFGRPRGGDEADGNGEVIAGCVNPAAPGGRAALTPYFRLEQPAGTLLGGTRGAQPFADPARTAEVTTPFVTYPGLVEGECVRDGEFNYLELTVLGDPDDPRTDDIGGDLSPEWGMHLIDANVAMGDILAMVDAQADAYAGG